MATGKPLPKRGEVSRWDGCVWTGLCFSEAGLWPGCVQESVVLALFTGGGSGGGGELGEM